MPVHPKDSIPLMKKQFHRKKTLSRQANLVNLLVKFELPPDKDVTRTDRDIWEVKTLHFKLSPVSKPSHILQQFIESQQQRHENLLASMNQELASVNEENEKKILVLSDKLKIDIANADTAIETETVELETFKDNIPIEQDFNDAWRRVKEIICGRRETIDSFKQELLDEEKACSEKAKGILKKFYHHLQKLTFKLPHELQEFFEYEILKINQTILNNVRCYEDLHLHLCLLGDKKKIVFKNVIEKQKLMWKNNRKWEARLSLECQSKELIAIQKNFLSSEGIISTEQGQAVQSALQEKASHFKELMFQWEGQVKYSNQHAKDWSSQLHTAVQELDGITKQMVELYRTSILQIFVGLNTQMEEYRQDYIDYMDIPASTTSMLQELEDLELKVRQPLLETEMKYETDFSHLEEQWSDMMSELQTTLQSTYDFLSASAKMWDNHFQRMNATGDVVSTALKQIIAKNNRANNDLEAQINIAIDKLRQETDEQKLNKSLDAVLVILDSIQERYEQNYINEERIINTYIELTSLEGRVLLAEIQRFLEQFPSEIVNEYLQKLRQGTIFPLPPAPEMEKDSFPKALKMCEFQVTALRNWKFGLREGIIRYQRTCKEDLLQEAQVWVATRIEQCEHQLEMKMALHQPRYQRLILEIHNVRLSELKLHQERLDGHQLGIKQSLSELEEGLVKIEKEESATLQEMIQKMQAMEDQAKVEMSSFTVSQMLSKVNDMVEIRICLMKSSLSTFEEESSNKISWLQESNVNFMMSIQLFSEEGNYSADEANACIAELEKIEKLITTHGEDIIEEINELEMVFQKQISIKGEEIKYRLENIVADVRIGEMLMNAISRVQDLIKKEVTKMKSDMNILNRKTNELVVAVAKRPGQLEDLWGPLMAALVRHHNYLLQPQVIKDSGSISEGQSMNSHPGLKFLGFHNRNRNGISVLQVFKAKQFKPSVHGNKRFTDYRMVLFNMESPPIQGKNFMAVVCKFLWGTLGEVQEAACEFYDLKGTKPIVRPEFVQPTYDNFVEEVLIKFEYYHLQCEEVWLDEVRAFLNLVHRLRQTSNLFIEFNLVQFHAQHVMELVHEHTSFIKIYKAHTKKDPGKHEKLANKLMPLHGYPGNKNLLKKLQKNVTEACIKIRDGGNNIILQYKKFLDEQMLWYQSEADTLGQSLQLLLDQLFDTDAATLTDVAYQVEDVLQGIQKKDSTTSTDVVLPTLTSNSINKSSKRQFGKKSRNIENPPPVITEPDLVKHDRAEIPDQHRLSIEHDNFYIKSIRALIEDLQQKSAKLLSQEESTILPPLVEPPVVPILEVQPPPLQPFDVAPTLDTMIQVYKKQYEEYMQETHTLLKSRATNADHWFKVWKFNVQKVKELYTVRYM